MTTEALTKDALRHYSPAVAPNLLVSPVTAAKVSEPVVSHSLVQLAMKRFIDILGSAIGLVFLSPFLLVVAALVALTSPGPIIYKSLRIGKNRQPFYMYKFRTMVANAEKQRGKLYEQAKLHGQLFKLQNDPRITPIGGFLRKYSLDEFPQLMNVLRGEMSLVGPRPYVPEESDTFKAPFTVRFNVIPGMTGPWQVTGRSNLTFEQLCHLEMDYVTRWTLGLDATLLFKTIPCVLLKKGAY